MTWVCELVFTVEAVRISNCLEKDLRSLADVECLLVLTVTAGVLRGERARFQLFGDTINTAVSPLYHSSELVGL